MKHYIVTALLIISSTLAHPPPGKPFVNKGSDTVSTVKKTNNFIPFGKKFNNEETQTEDDDYPFGNDNEETQSIDDDYPLGNGNTLVSKTARDIGRTIFNQPQLDNDNDIGKTYVNQAQRDGAVQDIVKTISNQAQLDDDNDIFKTFDNKAQSDNKGKKDEIRSHNEQVKGGPVPKKTILKNFKDDKRQAGREVHFKGERNDKKPIQLPVHFENRKQTTNVIIAEFGGQCGIIGNNQVKCPGVTCCSQWGWCGNTQDHCGAGCQQLFGKCN